MLARAQIIRLALPAALSSLNFALMEALDIAMLGQLGVSSMAGAALATAGLFLLLAFSFYFLNALKPLAAATADRGVPKVLAKVAFRAALCLGLVTTLLALVGYTAIGCMGYEPDLVRTAQSYLAWRIPGIGIELLFIAAWALLDGIGRTRITLLAGLIANAANALLNAVLIPGFGPIPALAEAGSALATDISAAIGLGVLWLVIHRGERQPTEANARELGRRLLRLGWPLGLSGLAEVAGILIVGLLIGQAGVTATAAHGVANKLMTLGFSPAAGLGVAATALIARSLARGRKAFARESAIGALLLGLTIGGANFGLLQFLGPWLGRLFTPDAAVVETVSDLALLWSLLLWTGGLNLILQAALEGTGQTRRLLWATLCFDIAIQVPLSLFAVQVGGLKALYGAWLVKDGLKAVFLGVSLFLALRESSSTQVQKPNPGAAVWARPDRTRAQHWSTPVARQSPDRQPGSHGPHQWRSTWAPNGRQHISHGPQ